MKRITVICLMLYLLGSASAQTKDQPWNLGFQLGMKEYSGDLGNDFFRFRPTTMINTITIGGTLSRYLSSSFDFNATANYGSWGYFTTGVPGFKAKDLVHLNMQLKYKFNNGYWMEDKSLFQPYLLAGAGLSSIDGDKLQTTPGQDILAMGGFGINYMLSEMMGINYQANFGYTLTSDNRDRLAAGSSNDMMLIHSVGLNFNLGKLPDADHDGVADRHDKCHNTPPSVNVDENGCPLDTDNDGTPDYLDQCMNEAGTAKGCPDEDKDGVADEEDQCPTVAGIPALKGCPDSDGDGIEDSKDECPNVKGSLAFKGCPDSDGDGIKDADDLCPDQKGLKLLGGCPDADLDSVPDISDLCPNVRGPVSNKGCPEVKKDVKQLFQKALQGIQFETGKAIILKQSNTILDAVVRVMIENPTYKLMIGGHTDDVGDDANNLTLSQNRANAVAAYLVAKGVNPMRVSATGYGETKPVDTNKTPAGRTRNRRVELEVEFME